MSAEMIKKEFDRLDVEEVNMMIGTVGEPGDKVRFERILAEVYRKTGLRATPTPEEQSVPDEGAAPAGTRRAVFLRFLPVAAVLAVVLIAASIAITMRINAQPRVLPRDIDAGPTDLVLPMTVPFSPGAIDYTNIYVYPRPSYSRTYLRKLVSGVLSDEKYAIRLQLNPAGESCVLWENYAWLHPHIVEIGEGVTKIGRKVFSGCTQLEEVYIPSSVTLICGDAFDGCVSLCTIVVSPENPVYAVKNGALIEKESGRIVFQTNDA